MSKTQKDRAELRHRFVYRLLVKEFPDCEVTYNGDMGIDHMIKYNGHVTWVETKTCDAIISGGIDKDRMKKSDEPAIFEQKRLGRFKFDRCNVYPYEPLSQHDWLVEHKGWYIFLVGREGRGRNNVFGISAKNLKLSKKPNIKRIAWSIMVNQCRPDWLDMLKAQVYNLGWLKQTKIGLKGPVKEVHDVWFKKCTEKACPIVEHLLVKKK